MRSFLIALALAVLAVLVLSAAVQPLVRYAIQPESRFWIDGASTAGAFTCTAARVDGGGHVGTAPGGAVAGGAAQATAAPVDGRLTVPVRAFDCGQRRMNTDFARALKADAHPEIRFEVRHARMAGDGADGWTQAHATGSLEIGGVRRPVTIAVEGRALPGNRVRLRGQMPMRMTDFDVEPPTGLFGLVRARDRIVVRFDLVATAQ